MIWLVLIVAIVALTTFWMWKKAAKKRKFFEDKGIKVNKPRFFLMTMYKLLTKQMGIVDMIQGLYNEVSGGEKVVGFYDGNTPILMLKDPDVIKRLAVKEFEHFQDRRDFINEEMDPLFGNSLFVLKEQKWRDMRATLSPAFTGSKMRLMCDFIVEIGEQMAEFIHREAQEKGPQVYEMKELLSRVAHDVIASCAFGIKVDSLTNKTNEVYLAGKILSNFDGTEKMLKLILYRFFPYLMKVLNISVTPQKESKFFRSLVTDSMKVREQQHIIRPDMIHLLMEANKGKLNHQQNEVDSAGFATVDESSVGWRKSGRIWSETEIVAQCFLFLLAGFESVSSAMSFAAHEICVNPDVQKKLYEEIKSVDDELNGKRVTYDILQKMKYLDMVVSETLRMYPPATIVDRECNKDITLELYDNFNFDFKKKYAVWIPIYAFHWDAKYFPDPAKFDPERFSDENKSTIDPSTYMPFGIGPRNCVGSRFALMELKSIIYYLVLNFSLEVTEKTQIPLKLASSFGALQSERGIHVKLCPRK
ncbi:probable cytochrome P450 9f2 [Phlebotomus argentipes]|uniref:probable cytochrome P450 9f2 n=1 Tax=Phlebotomus argentipes TaxID=94469 RepID=UPI00289356E5|nr:probable cytochrome P450 9f2 [Phlebotomus argentipes]